MEELVELDEQLVEEDEQVEGRQLEDRQLELLETQRGANGF